MQVVEGIPLCKHAILPIDYIYIVCLFHHIRDITELITTIFPKSIFEVNEHTGLSRYVVLKILPGSWFSGVLVEDVMDLSAL